MLGILAIIAAIGLIPLSMTFQHRWAALRRIGSGLLVSYITVVLLLGVGEVYFRYVHAAPEGLRARENWMARYWQENSLGFRDREWTPDDWAGKQTALVIGDSFTAGWGLENPADRFADVLAARLGDGWAVINLGRPGAATRQELRALQDYPLQSPDVVILQYFLNDIEDAALSVGQFQQYPQSPEWVRESYLANFIYSLNTGGFGPDYWAWEYAAYDNFSIWQIHEQELHDFADYVEGIGARLIVVIFPNMQDALGSVPYVDRVAQALEARGHTDILKLFDAVAGWTGEPLLVSPRDAHPSAAFHRYVGDRLYELFFASPEE